MAVIRAKAYIDHEGVIKEFSPGARVSVTSQSSIDSMKKLKKKKAEECEPLDFDDFVKANHDELALLMPTLKTVEKAFIASIMMYVRYDSCQIAHFNNKDIGTEELIKLAGVSRQTGYVVIESLISKHIIVRCENGKTKQYFMNPWLFARGGTKNKTLRAMFKHYIVRSRGCLPWYMLKD